MLNERKKKILQLIIEDYISTRFKDDCPQI